MKNLTVKQIILVAWGLVSFIASFLMVLEAVVTILWILSGQSMTEAHLHWNTCKVSFVFFCMFAIPFGIRSYVIYRKIFKERD